MWFAIHKYQISQINPLSPRSMGHNALGHYMSLFHKWEYFLGLGEPIKTNLHQVSQLNTAQSERQRSRLNSSHK